MNSETAVAMVSARMLVDADEGNSEVLYDYLEVLVGKTRARQITEAVLGLRTSEENAQKVADAIAAKKNAPATQDVKALQQQVADLQRRLEERERAGQANDELIREYRLDRMTERATAAFVKKEQREPTEEEADALRKRVEEDDAKAQTKAARRRPQ